MKLRFVALTAALAVLASAAPAQAKGLSKEDARDASEVHMFESGSCKVYPWSQCHGVDVGRCERLSALEVRCDVATYGKRTNQWTGETTATYRCERQLTWQAAKKGPELTDESRTRCEEAPADE